MNVVSIDSIERTAKGIAQFAVRKDVKQWVLRAVPRHIRKSEALLLRCPSERQIRDEWGKKRDPKVLERLIGQYRAGEKFWMYSDRTDGARAFERAARRVVDWLDAIPEWDRHLRRIDRMGFAEATALAEAWHERLLSLDFEADPDTVEEIDTVATYPDGGKFVEIKGPAALLREGTLMGHCVGGLGYVDAIRSGKARIFSLRDPSNVPHVTIEVRRDAALQIKGRGNEPPVERWAERVRPFVRERNWKVGWDGNQIGLFSVGGHTFDDPNDVVTVLIDGARDRNALRRGRLAALFPDGAMAVIRRRHLPLHERSRLRIVEAVAPLPEDVSTEAGDDVAHGPKGLKIGRRRHALPGALTDALAVGLLAGSEEVAAQALGAAVDEILARIEADPCHIHTVEIVSSSTGTRKGIFDQIAAFCGRGPRLAQVRATVEKSRQQRRHEIAAAIRTQTQVRYLGEREEGSWAHEMARLSTVSKDAMDRLRAQAGAELLI